MAEPKTQKRQVAYKVLIKDLLTGKYMKEEGWNPNYVLAEDGKKISRLNVIATIIDRINDSNLQWSSIVIDDGTGKINLRSFDNTINLDNYSIGDSILVVGRVREFGNQRYILPEIIKKIDNKDWIKLRMFELRKNINKNEIFEVYDVGNEVIDDNGDVFSLIKKMDKGDGADISEVLRISHDINSEKLINSMIRNGEIFEIKPGRIKILE